MDTGNHRLRILFLGGMFPKEYEKEIYGQSKGAVQYAANTLQWNIIKGFQQMPGVRLTVVSALFIGSYPKRFSKWNIEKMESEVGIIPFINFPLYKYFSRYKNVYKCLLQWVKKNKDSEEKLCIIAYSAHTPFIKAINKIKKKYHVYAHLIVPDLPEYMNLGNKNSLGFTLLKYVDNKIQRKSLCAVDSFTFLTEYMSECYNVFGKPYTVIEGMIDPEEIRIDEQAEQEIQDEEIRVVYTGTMNIRYGVLGLVNMMKYIDDPKFKLVLCGTGDGNNEIIKASKQDARIIFKGQVTREEALQCQRMATLLVNPRLSDEEYTKYSFPSKNLEYMLYEKPVLVFKLPGIPNEYDEVLNYFRSNEPEKMAQDIMKICTLTESERMEIGKKTTAFVKYNKNYLKQTRKIVSLCYESEL